jgi:ubiquinone/menaquinone biosynthesis C-methylase UbiE
VVDLGCGTGQLTQRLIRRLPDANIVGVDLSHGMLTEAAGRLREVGADDRPLVRADALQLPFAASSVDLVVCTESFHRYPDQASALAELARVLNPGGRLLIASIATVTDAGDRLLRRATGAGGRTMRALRPHRMRQLLVRHSANPNRLFFFAAAATFDDPVDGTCSSGSECLTAFHRDWWAADRH